jgi:N-methylhydantoinase A
MENDARQTLLEESVSEDKIEFVRSMDMGYEGQHHYVETPVPNGLLKEEDKKVISDSFENLHETRYGHRIPAPCITINIRLKAIGKIKDIPIAQIKQGKTIPQDAIKLKRKVYMDGDFVECQIYERAGLLCGNEINGPAIIEEPFHTTVVMPHQTVRVDQMGNLIINIGGA